MAASDPFETPMMKQFFSLKEKHPDAILLFRCGDFYETYGDDAEVAETESVRDENGDLVADEAGDAPGGENAGSKSGGKR